MVAVEWERVDAARAEALISMLLKNLYPDAERIWGAGGDEGRDVQILSPDGRLRAFEIKGFTGRLTNSRKQQIKRSLLRAAQLNPIEWTLLMPIDPTPAEEKWLTSLQKLVQFPTRWHWRDASFALTEDAPPETRRLWTQDGFRLAISTLEPHVAEISGREYRLGKGTVWVVESATMAPEHSEWRDAGPPAGAEVRIVPKDTDAFHRWLITEDSAALGQTTGAGLPDELVATTGDVGRDDSAG